MVDERLIKSFEYWKVHRGLSPLLMRKSEITVEIPQKRRKHLVISLSENGQEDEKSMGKKATREQAQLLMQKAVSEGRVSLQTAAKVEERLNSGRIKGSEVLKALTPLRKSQAEPKEDAIAALQHALDAKIITMQQWQKAFDELKAGKLAPTHVVAACRKLAEQQAIKEKGVQKSLPQSANYNGYSFDDIQARNELLKEYPLGQLLGL